jgi:hypothetical protein
MVRFGWGRWVWATALMMRWDRVLTASEPAASCPPMVTFW